MEIDVPMQKQKSNYKYGCCDSKCEGVNPVQWKISTSFFEQANLETWDKRHFILQKLMRQSVRVEG